MQSPDSHRYRHKYLLKCPYAFDTSAFDTGLHHYNLRQSLCSESVYHDGASPCTHQDTNDYLAHSNFRGRWKEVSGPNVTLASNQWMIVMRIGKQGENYDYHYWYRTNDGPWANKHGQTPSVLLPASDMPTTNSSSGWTLNGKTGFYNSSIVYCQLLSEYVISCACVPLCYTGAFCFGCFGTNWCC